MPNFIASSLKELSFPFGNDKIKFLWQANGRNERLIYTKNEEESFFLVVKGGKNGIVVKGEKLTKPAKVGLLQEALELFKEQNCSGIISQAFAVKKTNLTKKVSEILSLGNSVLPIRKSTIKNIKDKVSEPMRFLMEQNAATAHARPVVVAYPQVSRSFQQAMQDISYYEENPDVQKVLDSRAKEMQTAIDDSLKK